MTSLLKKDLEQAIQAILKYLEAEFSPLQITQFIEYFMALSEKNKVMNLTAITQADKIAELHLFDSLTVLPYLPIQQGLKIIDIGTGAGLPGIPLKIARPDLKLTLLDATKKRLRFIDECLQELNLKEHTKTVHARAEDAAHNEKHRECYDIAIARAVAPLNVLAEYCLPFVELNGFFIAMKGSLEKELNQAEKAIHVLGGDIADIREIKLPVSQAERSIILIQKIADTPRKFPRKAGLPKNQPLS